MPPRLHRFGLRRARLGAGLAVLLLGCSAAATFAPDGPCLRDGAAIGAYPDLEALLPAVFEGRTTEIRDSGRNCSSDALGTLAGHGVAELRFAGATWDFGNGRAATFAVLARPDAPLPVAWAEEFYETPARVGRRTSEVEVTRYDVDGLGEVYQLEALNDLSLQTVVVWQSGDRARVVIIATPVNPAASRDEHDGFVARALDAAAGG